MIGRLINNELEAIRKEAVVAKILYQYLSGVTEENNEKLRTAGLRAEI
jgi:hypothetical protein